MKLSEGLLILVVVGGLVGVVYLIRSKSGDSPTTPAAVKTVDLGYGVTLKL